MTRLILIALTTSIVTTSLCASSAAQEKTTNSTQAVLAIEIGDRRYGQMPVSSSERGYRQISPPEKRADWKQPPDSPAVTSIRIRPILEGDGVRVKIGVVFDDSQPVEAPGPKYGEKEEIVASYLAHLGDIVKVTELERFGINALELKVVLYQTPAVTDSPLPLVSFPKVVNELKSVGVVDWKPDDRRLDECRLILKNLSALGIVSVTLTMTTGLTQTIETLRAKPPLAKPGATFEMTIGFHNEIVDERTAVIVKAILFDDGSFDGDVEASATMAARLKGREIQLRRFLQLLRKSSASADERAVTTLQTLKSDVEKFRIDVDPEIVDELQARFPVRSEKRAMIAEKIMEGLKLARSHALSWIRDVERTLTENPGSFNFSQSLAALRERVAKMVEIP